MKSVCDRQVETSTHGLLIHIDRDPFYRMTNFSNCSTTTLKSFSFATVFLFSVLLDVMFRRCSAAFFAPTAVAFQRNINQGFEFLENRVKDEGNTSAETAQNLTFTLTRQDEVIMNAAAIRSVRLSTLTGEIGVMPNHEYKVARLIPGVIQVEETEGNFTKYYTSGGFAHINSDGQCDVNTVECIPLDDLDVAVAEKLISELTTAAPSTDKGKAILDAQLQTLEPLVAALK